MNNNFFKIEWFEDIIEHSSDLFCVIDQDFKIIDLNPSFIQFFGLECINHSFFKLLDYDGVNELSFTTHSVNKQYSKYKVIHWKQLGQNEFDQTIWVGKIDYDQKIQFLKETERIGKIGIWQYDVYAKEIFWSEEVYHIHEVPVGEKIKLDDGISFYHPADIATISTAFFNALHYGQSYDMELRIITRNKQIKWVRAIGERVQVNNDLFKVEGTFQDIHRTKTAELELQKNQSLLKNILDSLPVGIFWKNLDGIYAGFNKVSSAFIGLPIEELIGKKDQDIIRDVDLLNKIQTQDKEISRTLNGITEIREVKLAANSTRSIELKKLPLINDNGELFGILGVYNDITQLKTLIRSLEKKNKELNELLFVVSHGLKEPIQGINRFVQLLQRQYSSNLDDNGNDILDYILKETRRHHHQFNGLTKFLEIGTKEQPLTFLNPQMMVNHAVKLIDFTSFDSIDFELFFDVMPMLYYNEEDLIIIFKELLTNAFKFKHSYRTLQIHIGITEHKRYWEIIFRDNGIGFKEEFSDKLFKIFQKFHGKYEDNGAGIGLSICEKIVEHYGGKIWATSQEDIGTTFFFTIPKDILATRLMTNG